MKKRKLFMAVCIVWIIMWMPVAATEREASVTSEIYSGGVSIRMNQYGDTKRKQEWKSPEHILPGQIVPVITEIENLGEDCYIRYQVTAQADSGQNIPQTAFQGFPEDCVTTEGYIYLTEVLKHGEKTDLCTSFTLPVMWEQKEEDHIHICITADAIQSRNLVPDFQSSEPWGDIEIQKVSEEEKDPKLRVAVPQKGSCQVVIEGDEIITIPDDFFKEMGSLVPGDRIQGEIRIDNWCSHTESLYWKMDIEESTLLKQMSIRVEKEDGSILYDGAIQDDKEGRFRLLDQYPKGARDQLRFTLQLPEQSDNTYRFLNSRITWTFRAVSEEEEAGIQEQEQREKVKTGEDDPTPLFGLLAVSTGLILFLYRRKRHQHE